MIKRSRSLFPCPLCRKKVQNVPLHVSEEHKVPNALKFCLKYQHLNTISSSLDKLECPICHIGFRRLHHHLVLKHDLRGRELREYLGKSVKIGHHSCSTMGAGDGMDSEIDGNDSGSLQIDFVPNKFSYDNQYTGNINEDLFSDLSCFMESQENLDDCNPHQCLNSIRQTMHELKCIDIEDLMDNKGVKLHFDKLYEQCQRKSYSPIKSGRLRRPTSVMSILNSFKFFAEYLLLRFPHMEEFSREWLEISYPALKCGVEKEIEEFELERRAAALLDGKDTPDSGEKKASRRGRKRKSKSKMPASEFYAAYLQSDEIKNLEDEMRKYAEMTDLDNSGADPLARFMAFRDHMIVRMSVENTINPRVLKNFAMSSLLTSNEVDGLFYYTIPEGKISIRLVVGGQLVPLFAAYLKVREVFGRQYPNCPFVFPTLEGTQMLVADTRDVLSKAFKSDELRRTITTEMMRELASQVSLNISKEGSAMVTRRNAKKNGPVKRASSRRRTFQSSKCDDEDFEYEPSFKRRGRPSATFRGANVTVSSDHSISLVDMDGDDRKPPHLHRSLDQRDGKKRRVAWLPRHIEKLKELFSESIKRQEVPTLTNLRNIVIADEEFYNELLVERDINGSDKADLTKLFYAILCRVKSFL